MAHDCANTRNNDDKQGDAGNVVHANAKKESALDERQWELKVATWIYNYQI
jgi:hypothetical protein